VREAIERAPAPVVVLSGDQLRASTTEQLIVMTADAGTVALGGTGWSDLAGPLAAGGRLLLDPLDVALEQCLALLRAADQAG